MYVRLVPKVIPNQKCNFPFARKFNMLQLADILLCFLCLLKIEQGISFCFRLISSMNAKAAEIFDDFWTLPLTSMEKRHFQNFIKVQTVVFEKCKIKTSS